MLVAARFSSRCCTDEVPGISSTFGATLSAQLVLSGGDDPGEYALTMLASVVNGSLEITGWTMTPVSG